MIGLETPWSLSLLVLLLPYAWWRRRLTRRAVTPHPPLQVSIRGQHGDWRRILTTALLPLEIALLAVLTLGLAGPYREQELELIEEEGIDVMLVLDVSLSMLAEDFEPTRLDALRRIAGDFVARAGGHRLGILIFAGDVYVQSPLTTDRVTLAALLDGVTVHALDQAKSGGTALGDALLVAAERLVKRRVPGRDQALLLITDGESNLGIDPLLAAQHVREQEIRPYLIGIGGRQPIEVRFEGRVVGGEDSPYLAVLDDEALEQLADAGGGRYDRADDASSLERIFADLARLESAPLETRILTRRDSGTPWMALLAGALLALHTVFECLTRRPLR